MFPRAKTTLTALALTLALITLAPHASWAQSQNRNTQAGRPAVPNSQSAAPRAGEQDKIDVSELEKKYWAAKDSDFNVVQNRLFTKANRFSLTGSYGNLMNDPWSSGSGFGVNLGYYFSERYGVELMYQSIDSKDTQATQRIKAQSGSPNYNKVKQFYGGQFNWVPFYAKMSFLNSAIMYFDMSASLGLGMTTYEQQKQEGNVEQQAPTAVLTISQHFFLSRWLAIRVDYINTWYNQDVLVFNPNNAIGRSRTASSELNNNTLLFGGLTFFY